MSITPARTALLAGESWSTTAIHTKGFDTFMTSTYEEGGWPFIRALEAAGWTVDFLPNHAAAEKFPASTEALEKYDLVVLSDIGANTLLLPNSVFGRGERLAGDRLGAIAEWVRAGGSLLMVGGYLSFQGIEAKANYRNTALAPLLPVIMEIGDDREEVPFGRVPEPVGEHPITAGLPGPWPAILGYQRLVPRDGATVVAEVGSHPLIIVDTEGAGRVGAVATDMGAHWLPPEFMAWEGYPLVWSQLAAWLVDRSEAA